MGNNDDREKSDHDLLVALNTKFDALQEALMRKVDMAEFIPVRMIVFGLVSMISIGFVGAICSLVYRSVNK